jgi:hypothetical protein
MQLQSGIDCEQIGLGRDLAVKKHNLSKIFERMKGIVTTTFHFKTELRHFRTKDLGPNGFSQ